MTYKEKIDMMPHVCFLLDIINVTQTYGVRIDEVKRVKSTNDEFLIQCYVFVICGLEPNINKMVLENMVESESNYLKRTKMRIQKDAMLALQHSDSLNLSSLIIFSYFGLEFKDEFIKCVMNYDRQLHDIIFRNGDFRRFNIESIFESFSQ